MTESVLEFPSTELSRVREIQARILDLKRERNAILVVHNYQRDEIQEIADITGDSLALAQAAMLSDAHILLFCGVRFMAESANVLNPEKIVLLANQDAGCPMSDMVTPERLIKRKAEVPDAAVVAYVNCSAAVKAEADICCTSANAVEIVRSLPQRRILFVPDKNLAQYVQSQVPEKEILLWRGFCPTHVKITREDVLRAKREHPHAEFIAHPECPPDVLALADHIGSTSGMIKIAGTSSAAEFIIGTESGMLYKLRTTHPTKSFYLASEKFVCPTMKMTTLGWVLHALETMQVEIRVPEEIARRARVSLERMLEVSGGKKWEAIAGY